MDAARTVDFLNRVLHATVNSVVTYVETATPYVPEGCEEHLATVRRLRDEQAATAAELTDCIHSLDGIPKVGVFPYWNVDLNYLDLRFLAGFAAEEQERSLPELETDVELTRDNARVHGLLRRILEQRRAHIEALKKIAAAETPAPSEERVAAAQPKEPNHVPRPGD